MLSIGLVVLCGLASPTAGCKTISLNVVDTRSIPESVSSMLRKDGVSELVMKFCFQGHYRPVQAKSSSHQVTSSDFLYSVRKSSFKCLWAGTAMTANAKNLKALRYLRSNQLRCKFVRVAMPTRSSVCPLDSFEQLNSIWWDCTSYAYPGLPQIQDNQSIPLFSKCPLTISSAKASRSNSPEGRFRLTSHWLPTCLLTISRVLHCISEWEYLWPWTQSSNNWLWTWTSNRLSASNEWQPGLRQNRVYK